MKAIRITTAVLLAQGALPALAFGLFRPGGLFLLGTLIIYSILSWGVWQKRKWGVLGALAVTMPQVPVINGDGYWWQFFVGGSFGYGFHSLRACVDGLTFGIGAFLDPAFLKAEIITQYNFGANFAAGFARSGQPYASPFNGGGTRPFAAANLVAVGVLTLLLVSHRALQERAKEGRRSAPPPLPMADQYHTWMYTA